MKNQFQWREFEVVYRETRASNHGDEPRWIVNRETIWNSATGEKISRGILRHPGVSVIVPFPDDDHIVLMHQAVL